MTVTYEQAREIVRERFEPGWLDGTFCIDDRTIAETDEYYLFSIGAREFIIDGDWDYMVTGPAPVVFKADGRIETRSWAVSIQVLLPSLYLRGTDAG